MTNPSVSSTSSVVPSLASIEAEAAVNLTPEGLMLYLQSRLDDVDTQIDGLFKRQQNISRIRNDLNAIQEQLQTLKSDTGVGGNQGTQNQDLDHNGTIDSTEWAPHEQKIMAAIADIKQVDPALADQIEANLKSDSQVLSQLDGIYLTSQVDCSTKYISGVNSRLESSAQLEMIKLQSLMSNRQTAIQLSTNLVSALGESTKSVAGNIGR
jgi:hypothetical protein